FTLLGAPPPLSVNAPIPDSVAQALRHRGVLATGDVAQYVFAPAGAEDTTLLVVARWTMAVVTPHRVRAYPRDAVHVGFSPAARRRERSVSTRSRMPSGSGVPCRRPAVAPNAYPVTPSEVICASAENAARAPDRRNVAPGV